MVEIVFQLKQSGVSLENAQELVTKNPDLFIVNKQYGGRNRQTEVGKNSYFLVKTVMKKTHRYAAYDLNGG